MAAMTAYETEPVAAERASRAAGPPGQLAPAIPGSPVWGWAGPLLVMLFGAFLRFYRLSMPKAVVFDETYYVADAYGILRHGVEINHVRTPTRCSLQGKTNILGHRRRARRAPAARQDLHRGRANGCSA